MFSFSISFTIIDLFDERFAGPQGASSLVELKLVIIVFMAIL